MDCLFCKIIKKEIPAKIFYEDDECVAFFDIAPMTLGHTLVVPRTHCENILKCEARPVEAVARATHQIAPKLMRMTGAAGLNVVVSNEPAAGQEVFHMHWHLIPRYNNDGLKHWPKNENINEAQTDELLSKLKSMD